MILFLGIFNIKGTRTTIITIPVDMEQEHDKKNLTLCWLNSRTCAVYIQGERVIYRHIIGSRKTEKDVSVPSKHMNKIEDLCNDINENDNDNEYIFLLGEYKINAKPTTTKRNKPTAATIHKILLCSIKCLYKIIPC